MNNTIDIARKIKEIRERENLSQVRFGKKIGKTGKTICAYESGRCTPPLKVLEDISQVYDATFMSLKQSRALYIGKKIQEIKDILTDFEKIIFK